MKPPHARPDPRYYPPETPERDPDGLAVALVGIAAIVLLFVLLFVVVPVMVPGAPW